MAAGNELTETKPEPVGCFASLVSCFRVRTKKTSGLRKERDLPQRRQQGGKKSGALELTVDTNAGAEDAVSEYDENRSSVAQLIENIFTEVKEVPWEALEARILLYIPLAQQENDPTSQELFENLKAWSPRGDQVEQLSCVYVTPKGYFLKNSETADRGEFVVVPELPDSMQTTLINSILAKGYDTAFDVYKLRKGLRDTVDIPCLLVKW